MAAVTYNPNVLGKSRQGRMVDELGYALNRIPKDELARWGKESAGLFGMVTLRRTKNLGVVLARLGRATAREIASGFGAARAGRFKGHVVDRAELARDRLSSSATKVSESIKTLANAVRTNPKENAPALVVSALAFLAASGGVDGDGGVPDLDLVAGIGAHRSIFTHSILAGAAIETILIAAAALVGIAHAYLPHDHDGIWDAIAKRKDEFVSAAVKGASLGIAYHLFIDSTVDIGTYHDLPVSMPIEGHQAVAGANAAAEAIDVAHKSDKRD